MIRAIFTTEDQDYRQVVWPVKHPYWCTGWDSKDRPVVVAYADDEAEILKNWPDARGIESTEETEYSFSSRFPKPDWFEVSE